MSGEMSQEQLLELIEAQKSSGSGSKRLDDDSDSEEDILEPSTQARSSNRRGGGIRTTGSDASLKTKIA
jgi:hypothetical protein